MCSVNSVADSSQWHAAMCMHLCDLRIFLLQHHASSDFWSVLLVVLGMGRRDGHACSKGQAMLHLFALYVRPGLPAKLRLQGLKAAAMHISWYL